MNSISHTQFICLGRAGRRGKDDRGLVIQMLDGKSDKKDYFRKTIPRDY